MSSCMLCERSVIALISVGSSFHQEGARAEKAPFLVEARQMAWWLGISSRFVSDERKVLGGEYSERRSLRYVGPEPCIALKDRTKTLNLIRNSTGSQCSCCMVGRMYDFHGVFIRTRAAASESVEVSALGLRGGLHRVSCSNLVWRWLLHGLL